MDVVVRTMVQKAGIPLTDAIRMASETPARRMNIADRKGSLEKGKDADIVVLSKELEVIQTFCRGERI
jgi:N-acetylglucosamine-6-phosphate deacetylase